MKFIDLYNRFYEYPLLDKREVKKIYPDVDSRRFYEWQQKGYLKKIANNFYIFPNKKITDAELKFISNKLYEPSYISLEMALSIHSLIPESVFVFTGVSTRRTKKISNDLGNFHYRKIKNELFFGFNIVSKQGINYKIAEPEKALLDFLYLRSDIKDKKDLEELRINPYVYKEDLNRDKLERYLNLFRSRTLNSKINKLNKIL